MEFIRQMQITLVTGEWTIFEIYVLQVWTLMLPRSIGAGIFYSFRPLKVTKITLRYVFEVAISFLAFGWSWYLYALEQLPIWMPLLASVLSVMIVATPLRRALIQKMFGWTFYAKHVKVIKQQSSKRNFKSIVFITIFDEEPVFLGKCLKKVRHSFEESGYNFSMVAVVDGYRRFRHAELALPVAVEYCDIVITSDALDKSHNLVAMYEEVERRCWLQDGENTIIHLLDSDTVPANERVAKEILRPFRDPLVGGVSTKQFVYKPKTFWQKNSYIFEVARTVSSMSMMSLFGRLGCMPGRWYGVRAKYLANGVMQKVANDSFSYFGLMRRRCAAGDDRRITNYVLEQGGRTLFNPDAFVYTLAPADFSTLRKMWVRWGRSSQGYTIRSLWLLKPKFWPIAFVYWGDILLSFSTVFITLIHWPYVTIFGNSTTPLVEAVMLAFVSMSLMMTIRQLPMLLSAPAYLLYMFTFGFVAIFAHVCRVEAFCTQHKIGKWGTRAGADDDSENKPTFKIYHDRYS